MPFGVNYYIYKLFGYCNQKNSVIVISLLKKSEERVENTIKPVYNSHPWDPQKVAVVQRVAVVQGLVQNIS
jgi:hypothetical protein